VSITTSSRADPYRICRRPQDLVARIAADAAALQRDPDPKIDPGPRLDAVGGSLTIVSAPGDGSSVGGRVPVA
jgi:hypothetical protein